MGRQKSLGIITVATAGTPVRATTRDTFCESYMVEPWPDNSGKMWIGTSSTAFKGGTTDLLGYVPVPHANVVSVFSSGKGPGGTQSFNLVDLYIDADVNGESVLISYTS
jgi:hypothetical protein